MYFVGPHVSISGGLENAPVNARAVGATGFGMFVKNQRQWRASKPKKSDTEAFRKSLAENGYTPACVLPHAGYLINLANPDEAKRRQSLDSLVNELEICSAVGLTMLNLHPGSSLKLISVEAACDRVADALNRALAATAGVTVVLEDTAGTGGNLGSRFEELARIIDGVEDKTRIGVCLDTMHTFGAGFDLRTREGFEQTIASFDAIVGLKYLRGMHLNDSMVDLASHRDRHESLGKGKIGWEPFLCIMRDTRFEDMPLVLETPHPEIWPDEVKTLLAAAR
ncbi:MAG: deoxyribonuclease IV [Kiritimatiellae bacterium]|nr:deoxyribonuclease IV [Kiritimatiellia bacterium]